MNNNESNLDSNKFEIINNTFSEQDLLINRLENEIYQKQQKQRDFAEIHSKYEQLQADIIPLNELKTKLEKELDTLITESEHKIKNLEQDNQILILELNQKIEINENLYNSNNEIYIEIEQKEKENKNLENQIDKQENQLNNLNKEKNEIIKISRGISQKNELDENNINYLKNEINTLSQKNEQELNLLKNDEQKNIDIINEINEEQNNNKDLIIELKNKDILLNKLQHELNKTNQILSELKNIYSNINDMYQENQKEIIGLNDELIKEATANEELAKKKRNLLELINEGEKKIVLYVEENEDMKKDLEKFKDDINCLDRELKGYKEYFVVLYNQNNVLSKELNYFVERDNKLSEDFNIIEHLKEIGNKNNELIKNCIDN